MESIASVRNLLSQVAIINKKNTEILDATGGRFNMFQVCGVNHYENTHSAIIAEFLNPNGTHGLKSALLKCFIESLGDLFHLENFDVESAKVYTEYCTKQGRIDILIENNQKQAIIIENKIYASDGYEQLKRYERVANTYVNGCPIIYLTLFGSDAALHSGEDVSYFPISYRDQIIDWLERCVAVASRHPIVRETIIQYINHIMHLTDQDMDARNKSEISEMLVKNLEAAKVIFQNYTATFELISRKYFIPEMNAYALEKGLDFHYESSDEYYIQFHFTKSSWHGKYWIGFAVDRRSYFYGLCNNPDKYSIPEVEVEKLHESIGEVGLSKLKTTKWWPCWFYIPNLTLEVWENDIISSNHFAKECKNKVDQLLQAMDEVGL